MSRLPFIQVGQELIDQIAGDLAIELECSEAEAGWSVIKMWDYGLSRGREAPPDGRIDGPKAVALLEHRVGWKGPAGAFVEAVVRMGLVERTATGIRVRGMDRYERAWRKRNRPGPTKRGAGESPAEVRQKSGTSVPDERRTFPSTSPSPSTSPVSSSAPAPAAQPEPADPLPIMRADPGGGFQDELAAIFRQEKGADMRPLMPGSKEERILDQVWRFGQEEILRRWRIALRRVSYPRCATVPEMVRHWDHYAADEPRPKSDPRKGVARADEQDWGPEAVREFEASNDKAGPAPPADLRPLAERFREKFGGKVPA